MPPNEEGGEPEAQGVGEAVGGARAAFMRMLDAHIALLRAELAITGRELGIIAAVAFTALAVFALAATLVLVGGFLFYGEWLFGSMGWGIIHGTLVAGVIVGGAGVNLAGGNVRRYAIGALAGLLAGAFLAAVMLSNVGNRIFEWGRTLIVERYGETGIVLSSDTVAALIGFVIGGVVLAGIGALVAFLIQRGTGRSNGLVGWLAAIGFVVGAIGGALLAADRLEVAEYTIGDEWIPTLLGALAGAVVVGLLTLAAAWRADLRGKPLRRVVVVAAVAGSIVGSIFASTRYDAADGVMGLSIMVGLITWIAAGALLAEREGFDPEQRYANLVPRESIAAFEKSRDFLVDQWEQQKNRMMGR